jgi:two-component system CheB/CheR fusion protein
MRSQPATTLTGSGSAEEALRQSEERLRLAAEAAHLGTWHWDLGADRLEWSDECKRLFGIAAGTEMTYALFLAAVHPDDRGRVDLAVRRALQEGADYDIEYRTVWPDASVRWVVTRGRAYRDAAGKPVRMEGVALDVTRRKQAEEALREADRRKDEFLAMLAHELRNPLAPIRNALSIMRLGGPPTPVMRHARETIDRQVAHMARLIDDLLDVARIAQGKVLLRQERCDLARLVGTAAGDYRGVLESAGLELTLDLPAEPLWVEGDPTRLAQVVGNLLHNAHKFTGAGGRVSVRLTAEPGTAVLTVADTGIGLDPALLPRLFAAFTQGEPGLTRGRGGLGLGLALVKGLVAMHGGAVTAASAGPGQGSEFTVRLPLAPVGPV